MIIYPKKTLIQTKDDSRWISLKSNLYNTYVRTREMRYITTQSGMTEIFELFNDDIYIKINQSLLVGAGSKQKGIILKSSDPVISNIKNIIKRYYGDVY